PARARVEMDETLCPESLGGEQGVDAALGLAPWHQRELALFFPGLDAKPPERVEIELDSVPPAVRGQGRQVRETPLPAEVLAGKMGRDGEARAERTRKPCSARMLGQMHQQVVTSGAQCRVEPPLVSHPRERAALLPAAVHYVDLGDGGVQVEHVPGLGVD